MIHEDDRETIHNAMDSIDKTLTLFCTAHQNRLIVLEQVELLASIAYTSGVNRAAKGRAQLAAKDPRGDSDPLLDGTQAAKVLGAAPSTMKQSRYTGILFGVPAPAFLKMGRSARYRLSTLLEFRDQFPERSTAASMSDEEDT